jgi:uncharacterized protein (TIGR02145 family)
MKQITLVILLINFCVNVFSQHVGIGTSTPNSSALLEISSTTQGFLPPRMTITERDAIVNPAVGLTIYCTNCEELQVYSEGRWKNAVRDTACTFGGQGIAICNQVWMKKNLDVDHYRNGDLIPQVTDPSVWVNLTTGAWCYYNNDPLLGAVYGKLYNWYAVNDPRGLAPLGWHVPSDAAWDSLSTCLGGATVAGGKMKEAGTTHWLPPNTGADNSSGFSGLPGGKRDDLGTFSNIGYHGIWWSSTEKFTDYAWHYYLYFNFSNLSGNYYFKYYGSSVRCLRD